MFHARCPGLSLSRDAFSRSHGCDKFVVALGPIQHQGDRPSHRRVLIDVALRNHARGYLTSHPELCQILCLNVRRRYLEVLLRSRHRYTPYSEIQLRGLLARCGVEYNNKTSQFANHRVINRKGFPTSTCGGDIFHWPVVAQFNSITEFPLIQVKAQILQRKHCKPC